ncbi:MAG: DUF3764 domain-containing protein [Prochlorococcus sp.]|nr:DUF3764 domain-containing protein [Prochlorococcus sp.]
MTETTIVTFELNGTFDEWSKLFDAPEADAMHEEFGIKPLYRGCDKDNRSKVIVIHQSEPGAFEKFIAKNGEALISHGVKPETLQTSSWVAS